MKQHKDGSSFQSGLQKRRDVEPTLAPVLQQSYVASLRLFSFFSYMADVICKLRHNQWDDDC